MMDLVDQWLRWKEVSRGGSPATSTKYRNYLLRLSCFLDERDLDFRRIDKDQLEQFTGMHLFNAGLGARSRRTAIAAIKGFFSWARSKQLVLEDPASGIFYPKVGRRLPKAMPLSQAERILAQPDLDTFIGVRDLAILFLFVGCGLRVSDLVRLNESSLTFYLDDKQRERLILLVLGKGNKERLVPAPDEVRLMLRAYLGHPEMEAIDRLLPDGDKVLFVSVANRDVAPCDYSGEARRLAERSVNKMLFKYGDRAGVDRKLCHPHALRHLFGKEMHENDVNLLSAQAILGHAKPETTQIYSHIADRKLVEAVDKANPLRRMRHPVTDLARSMK